MGAIQASAPALAASRARRGAPPAATSDDGCARTRAQIARGTAMLARDAVVGVADAAEGVQIATISTVARYLPPARLAGWVSAFVYRTVRGGGRAAGWIVGGSIAAYERFRTPRDAGAVGAGAPPSWVSALNGAFGDHLAQSANPLALGMAFSREGRELGAGPDAIARTLPDATPWLVVFVHGLCLDPASWRGGEVPCYAACLEEELGCTAVDLHYNTGLRISRNGRALARRLQALVDAYPVAVERITLVGHSMGGLVSRSACHYAAEERRDWLERVTEVVCIASPHHGAPLERLGRWATTLLGVSRFTAPFAPIGGRRSAGILDLHGGSLRDEDWGDDDPRAPRPAPPRPVPRPSHVRHLFVAATLSADPLDTASRTMGDGLVPVQSALGRHADPARDLNVSPADCRVLRRTAHLDLPRHPEVRAQLLEWLRPAAAS